MRQFTYLAILTAFTLGLFMSLWLLSSCSVSEISNILPFATFNVTCTAPGGSTHIELWRTLLMTYILAAPLLLLTALLVILRQARDALLEHKLQPSSIEWGREQGRHMKPHDSLRFAFAHGTVQHGSRNQ